MRLHERQRAEPRVIATEATELIVIAGQPKYAAIGDVHLPAVSNADTDIIVALETRAHYVLLSGRWYVSRNELQGPWTFFEPAELPREFARIPVRSDHGHLRSHVPGTIEAEERCTPATRPAAPSGGLNRDYGARQRGAARSGAAPKAAPRASPRAAPGGGRK